MLTFWTSILAYFSFGEKLIPMELVAMGICFAGMVTITFSGSNKAEDSVGEATTKYSSSQLITGYSLVFICSWVAATCSILCRALKGINSGVIMFWHGCMGLTLATIGISVDYVVCDAGTDNGLQLFNYSKEVYLLMAAATLGDTIAVNFVTMAFQSDSSSFVSLISYLGVIYAFIADCLIFNESFTWVELSAAIGILIITVLISIIKLRETYQA